MEGLSMTPRTYFDSGCDEFKRYSTEKKLLDIGFATWYGHDIMDDIRYIQENYSYVSTLDIQRAIWRMMAKVNNRDEAEYLIFYRKNSLETDVEILLEDLMRRFRLPNGDRSEAYLGDSPREIRFSELDAMNGWVKAHREERRAYAMYSAGHWIMFPGDEEIINRFNTDKGGRHCFYPPYVSPEPWYGCPTQAKVVVLGNEARYDDFISRVQNIIMHRNPQAAEGVMLTVDKWIDFQYYYFYNNSYSSHPMRFAPLDAYNSPTYRHWLSEFRTLAETLNIGTNDDLFRKVAVINANPYPSVGADSLAAGMLPSHYFLRQLVRFIAHNNPSVKFILPSETLRRVWRTILGDVYTDLVAFQRMMVINKDKSISLTRKLTKSNAKDLHSLLR